MAKKHVPVRTSAELDGAFVVFLVGMRLNRIWAVHKWWPQVRNMTAMLRELSSNPQTGFLGFRPWFGRTILMLTYWRSMEDLLTYANDRDHKHRPAWQAFYRGADGSAGFWHESYQISPGQYETVYVDMPPFGLGEIGGLKPAKGIRQSAAQRIKVTGGQK